MRTIEICDETFEYLQKWLYDNGAEAWYTAQVVLDLEDYDGAIKSIVNALEFQRALADDRLSYNRVFDIDIKRKILVEEKQS